MADVNARLRELEEKKKKLQELRKNRQERAKRRETQTTQGQDEDLDVNKLLQSLVSTSAPAESDNAEAQPSSPLRTMGTSHARLRASNLQPSEVKMEVVPPNEIIRYPISVQTDPLPEFEQKPAQEEQQEEEVQVSTSEQVREEPEQADEEEEEEQTAPQVKEMPPEEAEHVTRSSDFRDFFEHASLLVERCLSAGYDPLYDFGPEEEESGAKSEEENVKTVHTFYDKRWCAGRTVTSIDWHPDQRQGILAASYTANPDAPQDPDGLVLLWNSHLEGRFERRFEAQSAVMCCRISPYKPNLIVGATYAGQIVLWDARQRRKTPCKYSDVTTESPDVPVAHAYPVYCMDIIGSQNAHDLVTISTDGTMAKWDIDNIKTPHDVLPLAANLHSTPLAPTCMAFPAHDSDDFVIGTEEGVVYEVQQRGSHRGAQKEPTFTTGQYAGPIMGLDFHPLSQGGDFAHLFISAGTDWTVKLWSTKGHSPSVKQRPPVTVFDAFDDYVFDAKWSPVHPALFASGDGSGKLKFWNINNDVEAAVYTHNIEPSVEDEEVAINRISWMDSGNLIATGDNHGSVQLHQLSEPLAQPRSDEASRLKQTLQDFKMQSETLMNKEAPLSLAASR